MPPSLTRSRSSAPLPDDELRRLVVLDEYRVLDTDPEPEYDELTGLAARLCATPVAALSFVDLGRQWWKSVVGADHLPPHLARREHAFCAWAVLDPHRPMVVEDAAQDARFRDNPLVTGPPGVRFYAGVPLLGREDQPLGSLCVLDVVPRRLDDEQLSGLQVLGRAAVAQLELRRLRQG